MNQNELLRKRHAEFTADVLRRMKTAGSTEGQEIDFKEGESVGVDKNKVARSLCGMANASGGHLLYGVSELPGVDGQDIFGDFKPFPDTNALKATINEAGRDLIRPGLAPLLAVVNVDGKDVVIATVLESDVGPHRTGGAKGQFFRRHGTRVDAMEQHDIAEMFGRRARPFLVVRAQYVALVDEADENGKPVRGGVVRIALHNTGRGPAESIYVRLRVAQERNAHHFLHQLTNQDFFKFLNATTTHNVSSPGVFEWTSLPGMVINAGQTVVLHAQQWRPISNFESIEMRFEIFCAGSRMREYRMDLNFFAVAFDPPTDRSRVHTIREARPEPDTE